jgi:lipopolysaccharide/colanic/teichoic acid biosynthesis glycosyltransferase
MPASDLEYVCTCTVVLDLKILATTLKQILFPQRVF